MECLQIVQTVAALAGLTVLLAASQYLKGYLKGMLKR